MVNQWGRDGNFSSPGRSSGAGGIIVTAVIALLIGAGAGYGGARIIGGGSQAEIATRDSRIAELQAKLAKLDAVRAGDQTSEAVLRSRIGELEDQVAAQKRTNESLKAYADEQLLKGRADAQAEIDALTKTLDEAGNAASELAKARKSLKVSELQIIELEAEVADQQAQIRKLRSDVATAADQGDAGVKALKTQIAALQTDLDKARRLAGDTVRLNERLNALNEDLVTAETARDDALKQVKVLRDKQQALAADLKDTRDKLARLTVGGGETEKLQAQLRALKETVSTRDATISDLRARVDGLKDDVSRAESDAKTAESLRMMTNLQLGQLKTENEALQTQIAGLKKTVADLKAKVPRDEDPKKDKPKDNDTDETGDRLQPRDRDDVERALADTPGFFSLSPAKQEKLADQLVKGECVGTSLKAAYGRVPAVALRNLIRDLDSSC